MTVSFLGDSITLGYALEHPEDRFSTALCRERGFEERNFGITGTLMAKTGMNLEDGNSFLDRVDLLREGDFAVIFGGTNDYFWSDTPIYPAGVEFSDRYFAVAVDRICQRLLSFRAPKDCLLVTPYPHCGTGNFPGGVSHTDCNRHETHAVNYNGHVLSDYVFTLADIASRYGIPVLNLHTVPGFDWRTMTVDGCHPNPQCHRWLAQVIGETMGNLLGKTPQTSSKTFS